MPPLYSFNMDWNELLGEYRGRSSETPKRKNLGWLNTLFSGASGVLGTILQNVYNTRQIESTNKSNEKIVDMQNQAAAAESEKAYKRSLPQNQVANMMNAGMSRAGAINALNGGGHYQPAPVSASMDAAPQIDLSSAINAIQASAQLAEQKRQFNLQHAEQKRQFNEQVRQFDVTHKETKRVNDANINHLIEQGKILVKQAEKLGIETDILETNKEILNLTKQDYIDAQNAENLARKVRSENEKYIEDVRKKGLQHLSHEDLQLLISNVTERQMLQTTLEMFGIYVREHGHDAAKKFLQESLEQSLLKGSPLTNAIL